MTISKVRRLIIIKSFDENCKVKLSSIHWNSVTAGTIYTVGYLDNFIPRGTFRGLTVIGCGGYSSNDFDGLIFYVQSDSYQYGGTVYYRPSVTQNDVTLGFSILYSN